MRKKEATTLVMRNLNVSLRKLRYFKKLKRLKKPKAKQNLNADVAKVSAKRKRPINSQTTQTRRGMRYGPRYNMQTLLSFFLLVIISIILAFISCVE